MSPGDAHTPARLWTEGAISGTLSALWGVKVSGRERIPAEGPLIIAGNHTSNADAPLLNSALLPVRRPWYLGKKELYSIPLLGRLFLAGGSIPLDRKGDVSAMREALAKLAAGGALVLFPEGTRQRPDRPRSTPKAGVGFLAARSGARVLPARLLGADRFPWASPLEVRFGEPLDPPATDDRPTALAFAQRVMDEIWKL